MSTPPQPAGPAQRRIVVTAGNPTDAELAAVAVALARHHAEPDNPPPAPPSRWTRAARLEACGHPPIDSPDRFPR